MGPVPEPQPLADRDHASGQGRVPGRRRLHQPHGSRASERLLDDRRRTDHAQEDIDLGDRGDQACSEGSGRRPAPVLT